MGAHKTDMSLCVSLLLLHSDEGSRSENAFFFLVNLFIRKNREKNPCDNLLSTQRSNEAQFNSHISLRLGDFQQHGEREQTSHKAGNLPHGYTQ